LPEVFPADAVGAYRSDTCNNNTTWHDSCKV
jgi:hypothetical protein